MKTLEADFKIVTPLFMSGADQAIAELRPPSIKGIIRFWWRALAYSRFKGDLVALAKREEELFGSTKQVASIIIRVSSNPINATTQKKTVHQSLRTVAGARYLGYGLMVAFGAEAGKLQRPCINHNQQFNVTFISKSDIPQEFIDAVKLMGLLGGLGSRSRKGFGSLALNKLTLDNMGIWAKPLDNDAYRNSLTTLLNGIDNITEEPPFSAFSQLTRIDYLLQGNDPVQLLNIFGQQMQRYRSWGHHGSVNGENSEQNFEPDHQWYKGLDNYRDNDFHPQRIIFGLPQNYSKFERDNVTGAEHDRRASPLLVHVHEYAPNRYSLISIVLRSNFLPDEEKINAGNQQVTQHIEWDIIDKFLDGYIGHRDNKTTTPYFPNKNIWFGG
jgi:CRISPR-associated protein Cmr1